MATHEIVTHGRWIQARRELLTREKEFTRLRDQLNEERRKLPWEAVERNYVFEGEQGEQTLSDLFDGRSQLVVYHAMFAPDASAACKHCSFWLDNFQGALVHLRHRDVTLVAASRAPYAKLAAYKKRMGWSHAWVSSAKSSFTQDYRVSFTPEELKSGEVDYNYTKTKAGPADREGVSVFFKDVDGRIFHTYSAYARGIDMLNVAYHYLDIVPKGRDEAQTGPGWVRRHDEYGV